ncbi:MAG: RNA polymerase sigma factor [Polyangiaceae bacterium]
MASAITLPASLPSDPHPELERRVAGREQAVFRGEVHALSDLYRAHARYVGGVVYRLMGDDRDLEDVVQETFVDALDGLARLEDPSRVRGWLVTVAVRRAHKLLARRRRRGFLLAHCAWFSANASDPEDRRPVDELYEALDGIPVDLRVPWILHRIEHMTLPEVAAATGVSLATVKRRIDGAQERITKRLSP